MCHPINVWLLSTKKQEIHDMKLDEEDEVKILESTRYPARATIRNDTTRLRSSSKFIETGSARLVLLTPFIGKCFYDIFYSVFPNISHVSMICKNVRIRTTSALNFWCGGRHWQYFSPHQKQVCRSCVGRHFI